MHIISLQQSELNQRLSARCLSAGFAYLSLAPFSIRPIQWCQAGILHQLQHADVWIFLSPNAVQAFAAQWPAPWPLKCLMAIGQGTYKALRQQCDSPILVPSQASSEGLLALEALQHVEQLSILLIKGRDGRMTLHEQLTARGAQVRDLWCYERLAQQMDVAPLIKIWQNKVRTMILATSSEALTLANQQLTPALGSWFRQQPVLVTSQRLYQQAQALEFYHIHLMTDPLSDTALFDAILAIFKETP